MRRHISLRKSESDETRKEVSLDTPEAKCKGKTTSFEFGTKAKKPRKHQFTFKVSHKFTFAIALVTFIFIKNVSHTENSPNEIDQSSTEKEVHPNLRQVQIPSTLHTELDPKEATSNDRNTTVEPASIDGVTTAKRISYEMAKDSPQAKTLRKTSSNSHQKNVVTTGDVAKKVNSNPAKSNRESMELPQSKIQESLTTTYAISKAGKSIDENTVQKQPTDLLSKDSPDMKIENKHISQAVPKAPPSAKESSAKKDMEQVKSTPLSPSKDTSLENKSTQKHANTKVNESLPVQSKASPVQQVMFSSDSEGDKPKALSSGIIAAGNKLPGRKIESKHISQTVSKAPPSADEFAPKKNPGGQQKPLPPSKHVSADADQKETANHLSEHSNEIQTKSEANLPSQPLRKESKDVTINNISGEQKKQLTSINNTQSFKKNHEIKIESKLIETNNSTRNEMSYSKKEAGLNVLQTENPKVYIHIGAPKTGTTSIQNTMAMDKDILKQDNYFLALHGQITEKGKPKDFIIDNMLVLCDRLGACVWSDEERQLIAKHAGNSKAGICPDHLLPAFGQFLSKAIAEKSNVVISNEWLIRPSSESGLLKILKGWDPVIVIYYRRFFDWIISAHYQWHFDISIDVVESFEGKVRLIDFIRNVCAALFAPNAANIPHSPDDDANLGFVNLIDVPEYTYQTWMRYKAVPEYNHNNIKVVNFHDGDVVKSMYCEVLSAENACKVETQRLESGKSIQSRPKVSTVLFDLAVGVYWKDKNLLLNMDEFEGGVNISKDTFLKWGDALNKRMVATGFTEDDLPKECLTKSEENLLLDVSLAYEHILKAEVYYSGGREKTSEHFKKILGNGGFCSVDTEAVLKNPKWAFLFEKVLKNKTLLTPLKSKS